MVTVVLGIVILIVVLTSFFFTFRNQIKLLKAINAESEMIGENLNHVAGAIVSLSELLEEADQMVEEASKIPSMGEMMQQMIIGFIAQKMQPVITPLENVTNTINQASTDPKTWLEKDEKSVTVQEETAL